MSYLRFNKAELVNLSYSLKREIICANKTGAYCNTSIVTCNTRRYHGLLAVPADSFGGRKHLLLSSLDESLSLSGQRFNLGIHRYGEIYEPRGHKYIIDFEMEPLPKITYRVGGILLVKTLQLMPYDDQVLVRYELLSAPGPLSLELKPFLAFRDIHDLTRENPQARTEPRLIPGGAAFRLYEGFPDLNLQVSGVSSKFLSAPVWYKNVTYSDEARRGFACEEDLFVPGHFEAVLYPGDSLVFSAGVKQVSPAGLKRRFSLAEAKVEPMENPKDRLFYWADILKQYRQRKKLVSAGFSWLGTGLLRETVCALPGLTLYAGSGGAEFEEILDNLIADNQERLFRKTTQIEVPLRLAGLLQRYIAFGASPSRLWAKYGPVVKAVLESYLPQRRREVSLQPNGLLWAQCEGYALTWMNAYIDGGPVTERAGFQVETNAFWYNSLVFALEMEKAYGKKGGAFVGRFEPVLELAKANFQPLFWNEEAGCLADYVDNRGQHLEVRPNMLYAISEENLAVSPEVCLQVMSVIDKELVTARGIRTLSPRFYQYKGVYEGSQRERDLAYHNGCTRPFLLAPYTRASYRLKGESFVKKLEFLTEGFYAELSRHGVGAFSELYDGDPPHEPHGAIASALSTAALIETEWLTAKFKEGEL